MKQDIIKYVAECDVCQRNKNETVAMPGLLQPLPIPTRLWSDISMDFIEGLPSSTHKTVIMVVVDRLSKYAHFIPLTHPYTATTVAQAFLDNVFKLHGMPSSIVSDRDPIFTSKFWQELFRLQGTTLSMSTAYQPQSDGQTEVVNRCLENYLRCLTSDRPLLWTKWLSLAEWWYNTTFHISTGLIPYEALYGQTPPNFIHYAPGGTAVAAAEKLLQDRETTLKLLKEHLINSQHRMKQIADNHRTERAFMVGDWVYLRLQPCRQVSVAFRRNAKLAPKFFGPYQVLQRIGPVANELALPASSRIHPVFHVSLLKKKLGLGAVVQTTLPVTNEHGQLQLAPLTILDRKMIKRNNRPHSMVLVQWTNSLPEDATWESWLGRVGMISTNVFQISNLEVKVFWRGRH